jgi:hypothetical protein
VSVLAQAPPAPKPGPEHKALAYFVGKWTGESELKPGPLGPGGKMTSVDTCEWFGAGFHVVCRGDGKGVMGEMKTIGILSYNTGNKTYHFYGVDSIGSAELATGTKNGGTWGFTADSTFGGMAFKSRYTIVEGSPTSYTFKWEMSQDGTKWATVMEGKATKSGT